MIHAACSNSNHLQTRQKPDADKGWRNQCRLSTAILPIHSAFQSEHLGPREKEASANSGSFLSPGTARWNHVGWSHVQETKLGLRSSDVWAPSLGSPQFQTHLDEQQLSPALWLGMLCGFHSERLELEHLAHPLTNLQVMLGRVLGEEGWSGVGLVPVLYYSCSHQLNGSGLAVSCHTRSGPFPAACRLHG